MADNPILLTAIKYRDNSIAITPSYGKEKYRGRKAVLEFTSEREERQKALVHSCIRGLDSIGMSL